jgi:glycosyltransferase involved in cell wall biosynthesis
LVKRGLVVSYYFPPTGGGGVQRWVKLIKYLQPLGWNFTVLSSEYCDENLKDLTLLEEIPADTKVLRIPVKQARGGFKSKIPILKKRGYWQRWMSAFINITDSREFWNRQAYDYLMQELRQMPYDVVILSSPPYSMALLAAELTDRLNLPIILDLRDPWTINPYKIHPTILHRLLDKSREKRAIGKINYIISAYGSTLDDYGRRIKDFEKKKTLLLPNGYDELDFSQLDCKLVKNDADMNIGFSGSFYSHLNKPHQLFKAIQILKNQNINVQFHHIGSSVYNLELMAKKYGIEDNIRIWGYKKHRECLESLACMDVLCMILDSDWPDSQYTIGGKFYEYLRLKKPILALVPANGEADLAIRQTDSGVVVSDKRVVSIVAALKKILNSDLNFSWRGIEKFDRRKQAEKLNIFLVNKILNG